MKKYINFCIKNGYMPIILSDSFIIKNTLYSYIDKKTNLDFVNITNISEKNLMINISQKIGYPFSDVFKKYDKEWKEDGLFRYTNLNKKVNLIKNFHRSLLHSKKKGKLSPFEGINNPKIREKVIINRMIYGGDLNINVIMDGLTISFLAPRVSIFSPNLAKTIIEEFNIQEVTDPFSGFSGRMIGAQMARKKYRGSDIRDDVIKESLEIANYLKYKCDLKVCDFKESWNEGDTLFTCPPYGEKELWKGCQDYENEDFYIDYLLQNTKFKKYFFVVKNTKHTNNIIKELRNGSWSGHKDNEKLLVFKK